jgi:hypothetical protein
MSESHDNQLDQVLQGWAKSQSVAADDLASLQRRIEDRMRTEQLLSPASIQESRPAEPKRRRLLAPLAAIAAAILVAFFAGWTMRPLASDDDFAHLIMSRADRIKLLGEYKDVFGPELSWLVEQPTRAEIGLRPAGADASTLGRDFVAVRLTLVARTTSSKEWKEVQSLDVVTRREEVVEVAAKSDRHPALTLWAYPLDDNMISIDLRYEPSEFAGLSKLPSDFAIESSTVQSLGEPAPVMSFENDGVEYRLYQSAVLLPESGVG